MQLKQQYLYCNHIINITMGAVCHVYSVCILIGTEPFKKQILKVYRYIASPLTFPLPPKKNNLAFLYGIPTKFQKRY